MFAAKIENSLGKTTVYVIPDSEVKPVNIQDSGIKMFLIPYKIEDHFVSFAPISKQQYTNLKKISKEVKRGLEKEEYVNILDSFLIQNGKKLIKIFIIKHVDSLSGNDFCICSNKLLLPKGVNLFCEHFKSLYVLKCSRNPSDFELPRHLVCVMRSFQWPFQNELNDTLINLFRLTFPGRGLKRNCTHHEGSFEMIGERNSKQSTGSLLELPKKVDQHQFFRENMNLNLLPHAKTVINELMEQSIIAGYTSGECIMNYMKKITEKRC